MLYPNLPSRISAQAQARIGGAVDIYHDLQGIEAGAQSALDQPVSAISSQYPHYSVVTLDGRGPTGQEGNSVHHPAVLFAHLANLWFSRESSTTTGMLQDRGIVMTPSQRAPASAGRKKRIYIDASKMSTAFHMVGSVKAVPFHEALPSNSVPCAIFNVWTPDRRASEKWKLCMLRPRVPSGSCPAWHIPVLKQENDEEKEEDREDLPLQEKHPRKILHTQEIDVLSALRSVLESMREPCAGEVQSRDLVMPFVSCIDIVEAVRGGPLCCRYCRPGPGSAGPCPGRARGPGPGPGARAGTGRPVGPGHAGAGPGHARPRVGMCRAGPPPGHAGAGLPRGLGRAGGPMP